MWRKSCSFQTVKLDVELFISELIWLTRSKGLLGELKREDWSWDWVVVAVGIGFFGWESRKKLVLRTGGGRGGSELMLGMEERSWSI